MEEPVTAGASPQFIDVAAGRLALVRRPKLKAIPKLKELGATHLVTLLADADAAQLGKAAHDAGLQWIWMPFYNGDPPDADRDNELAPKVDSIADVLRTGGHVVLHCSAGIHRTGMFAYAVLRQLGLSREAAIEAIARMSPTTAEHVGAERLAWGDRLAGR